MNFLIILLAVAAEFMVSSFDQWRSAPWSLQWANWLTGIGRRFSWWQGAPAVALIIALPLIAAAGVLSMLDAMSPLLGYVAAFGVLLFAFGPEDLTREVDVYKSILAGAADGDINPPAFVAAARGTDLGAPSGDAQFDATRAELAALALAADRAWFQPLFWFFILGPIGAIAYRLVANLRRYEDGGEGVAAALAEVREAIEWLPARITVLLLGVAGTLVPVLDSARAVGVMRWRNSGNLVACAALAAADNGRIHEVIGGDVRIYRINFMLALLKRVLTGWLVVIAAAALLLA
jgi:AmpE protein